MTLQEDLLLLAAFIAGAAAILPLALWLNARQSAEEQLHRRLGNRGAESAEVPTEILARDAAGWVDREFYALLSGAGSELSAGTALALVAGAGVVGAVPALLAWENLLLAVAGALVGFALPLLWWMFLRWSRLRNMQRNLPQALDLLADSLASGQTLEQSAEMVAMQAVPPLREEFAHCVTLLRMGQSPLAVMERMSRRIPLPEFKLFSTAVLVHQQTGGDLAKLTARLANSARDRQEFLRHLGGQTVAGRYSALGLVACGVLGTLALIATRPQYMEFFIDHPAGISLLLTSAALVLVGSFWISRILKIAY